MATYYSKKQKKNKKQKKYVVDDDLEDSLGNLVAGTRNGNNKPAAVQVEHLDTLVTLSRNPFGHLNLVRHHTNYYVLDVRKKSELVRLKQIQHCQNERDILDAVKHPFIVHMYRTFQDEKCIYYLLEYNIGGDLLGNLRRHGLFSNDEARFCVGEVILALETLHELNVIHRDVKPENIVFCETGHLKLASFGFAKILDDDAVTYTFVGTPEYLAPEVVQSQGHGKAVDWWALGVLMYEVLCGAPPFQADHPTGVYERMLSTRPKFPNQVDGAARDLISLLLVHDPDKRIGNLHGLSEDVKQHRWFKGLNWSAMNERRVHPPERFVPNPVSEDDFSYYDTSEPPEPCLAGSEIDPFKEYFADW